MGQVMWPSGLYTMPIPELTMPDQYSHKRFLERALLNRKWSIWPRRCHASGQWLWLTKAYRAMHIIYGPGDPAIWVRWYSSEEMLLLKLKGY